MAEPFVLTLILATIFFSLCVFIYNWRRRWLYYYASKLPGPFAFPLIGSLHLLKGGPSEMYTVLKNLFETYPNVFKVWFGPDLHVSTTNVDDLKVLMTNFLDKGDFYSQADEYFRGTLAGAQVEVWKQHRKLLGPSFNMKLIESFLDIFVKRANILCDNLVEVRGKSTDVFLPMWRCTFDAACETFADIDANSLKDQDAYLKGAVRVEEIMLQRFFNPIWYLNIFWRFSWLKQEVQRIWNKSSLLVEQIISLNRKTTKDDDFLRRKRFLNVLLDPTNSDLSNSYILNESSFVFFVGSETSAVALSSCLILLGMHPEVQDKIDAELASIFEGSDRNPTLEDVNRMDYVERVIKESLRLLPPIPVVMRSLDKNVHLESGVFPAHAKVIIPIVFVHRHPDLWPDPLKFDPDRFLPEQVENRHPLAFMPFSYGVRNCIGYKYAILSMKAILSTILRRFRVKPSKYKTVEEVQFLIHIIAKLKDGFEVILETK